MIPSNITREHVIQALKQIDRDGMPPERQATKYSLLYEGKRYAPKYVISVANRFANGRMLDHKDFSGGYETNDFLIARGFQVINQATGQPVSVSSFLGENVSSPGRNSLSGGEATPPAPKPLMAPKASKIHVCEGEIGHSYQNLFGPYLKGARRVHITDPYVRMEHQIRNLIEFAGILDPSCGPIQLALTTSAEDAYQEKVMGRKFKELEASLSQHGIVFSFEFNPNIHDRVITTDTGWSIHPGRGLDIFQKPESDYALGRIDQTKRQCRETDIVFVRSAA